MKFLRSFARIGFGVVLVGCSARLDVGDEADVADVPDLAGERIATARSASVVALGAGHGCAVLEDTTVACWGSNRSGETGVRPEDSADPTSYPHVVTPTRVPGLGNVVQITAASHWVLWRHGLVSNGSTYALRSDGKVFGWGAAWWDPWQPTQDVGNVPREVPGVSDAVKVADGGGPACALRRDGTVICWGSNGFLSAGASTADSAASNFSMVLAPTPVAGITDAIDIAISSGMSCVRHRDGDVSCWGSVQIADHYTAASPIPVKIPGVHRAVAVAIATGSAIALLADGTVMGWGESDSETHILGQIYGAAAPGGHTAEDLGVMISAIRVYPAVFPGLTGIASIRAEYQTMCALGAADGSVRCWGHNDVGELGQGRTSTPVTTPTRIEGVVAAHLEVGAWNSCVVGDDNRLVCWGNGSYGALGTGKEEAFACKVSSPVLLPAPLARSPAAVP